MRLLIAFLSLYLFYSLQALGQSDGITYLEEIHEFVLKDLDTYKRKLSVHGINTSAQIQTVGFPVNELATLKAYAIYEKKGKGWKLSKIQKNPRISSLNWSAFFTGTKNYYFQIPPGVEFRLEFTTQEKHSIFISKLYREGWFESKHVSYSFDLPVEVQLSSRDASPYSGSFSINELDFDSLDYWPCIIHPTAEDPIVYFSNWFEKRISPQLRISDELVPSELKRIHREGTRFELAKACFDFVKYDIKYIAIENGINAIIPRQCEKVLANGLGDCKDMTTLLTALYRYFEFEAYSGVSRTNSMEGIFDFPSIALANHSICALNFEDQLYFLDATEDACLFGDPSTQIMRTEVFLVGEKSGDYFKDVPPAPRSNSSATFDYSLNTDNLLQLELVAEGKMNQLFYYAKLKDKNPVEQLEKLLDAVSGFVWSIDSLHIVDTLSVIYASAQINSSTYSKVGGTYMYDIGFIPGPEMLSALFQNSRFPRYDAVIEFALNFDGLVMSNYQTFSELSIQPKESQLTFACKLEASADLESFEEDDLLKEWNKFIAQPLIIKYEK